MKAKNIITASDSRSLIVGVSAEMADVVGSTLGPGGLTVIIGKDYSVPHGTKDGASVARDFKYADPARDHIAHIIKEAAVTVARRSGDGTTTTTILIAALIAHANKAVAAGAHPARLARHMDRVVTEAVEYITSLAKEPTPDDFHMVAEVATNQDKSLAALISDAAVRLGKDGIITVSKGNTERDEADEAEGYLVEKGYEGTAFITDQVDAVCSFIDPLILVVADDMQYVSSIKDIRPVMQLAVDANRPLLIISNGLQGEALAYLGQNLNKGVVEACLVVSPSFGDYRRILLDDLCAWTGASLMGAVRGKSLANIDMSDLGTCGSVYVTSTRTVMKGRRPGSAVDAAVSRRVSEAEGRKAKLAEGFDYDFNLKRVSSLRGLGICDIKVGGRDEFDVRERMDRAEDAAKACASIYDGGILPGGATAFIMAHDHLRGLSKAVDNPDAVIAYRVVCEALLEPFKRLHSNNGNNAELALGEVLLAIGGKKNRKAPYLGVDVNDATVKDLREARIVDPCKVVTLALKHASATATNLIRCGGILANIRTDAPDAMQA